MKEADVTVQYATLARSLQDSKVGWDKLNRDYPGLLKLVEKLLGVVPNCDQYLEIWPPAFRSYNAMVPNLLNLPVPVLGIGGPPPGVVGLAMYTASRAAGCAYCSAHSCSFAMRRGAPAETVAAALLGDDRALDPGELAAVAVAVALAQVPSSLTQTQKDALISAYGAKKAEWIVLGVVMMGFLNKFMDALGVELEQAVVDEVANAMGPEWTPGRAGAALDPRSPRRPSPPVDGLRTRLGLVKLLPSAISYDRRVQRGVPKSAAATAAYLRQEVGHDFPVLARLRSNRARRAMATMLRENLDPSTSVIGIETKLRAGAVFCEVVGDDALNADIATLAGRAGVALDVTEAGDPILDLARAASSSPAAVDASTIEGCERAGLSPSAVVEIVTWLAVLQMLHRLTCWSYPSTEA